jgi:hypothetical protein
MESQPKTKELEIEKGDRNSQRCMRWAVWTHSRTAVKQYRRWIAALSGQSGFTYESKHLNWWHGRHVHMAPHEEGMVNMKNTRGGITVGNGEVMVAKKTGDIPCESHPNTINMMIL